ncbi:TPR-like protein [Aulographum hederae CBS 113979]|uniref:TPR-like protein n=1 Tax=Aulographum hederae CBS 113979 TaxID=1176131 RepID=A0A6G1H308_9PEZI|nr:TPR-like protein [Aulographum hederae CBS 113979]
MDPKDSETSNVLTEIVYYSLDNQLLSNALFFANLLYYNNQNSGDAAHLLSLCHFRSGDVRSAQHYSKNHGSTGKHLGAAYVYAQACLELGGHEQGKSGSSALLACDVVWDGTSHWNQHTESTRQHLPDEAAARSLLGKLYCEMGDVEKAEAHFFAALRVNPFMWDVVMRLSEMGMRPLLSQPRGLQQLTKLGVDKDAVQKLLTLSSSRISSLAEAHQGTFTRASATLGSTDFDQINRQELPHPWARGAKNKEVIHIRHDDGVDNETPSAAVRSHTQRGAPSSFEHIPEGDSRQPERRSVRLMDQTRRPSKRIAMNSTASFRARAGGPTTDALLGRTGAGPFQQSENRAPASGMKSSSNSLSMKTGLKGRKPSVFAAKTRARAIEGLLGELKPLGEGYHALSRSKWKGAIRVFGDLDQPIETPWLVAHQGLAFFEAQAWMEAIRTFEVLRQIAPTIVTHLDIYSTALYRMNRKEALAVLAKELVELDPFCPEALIAQGNSFSLVRSRESAINSFRMAAQLAPSSGYASALLGHELLDCDDIKGAEEAYKSADSRQHYTAWYGLGRIARQQGEYVEAISYFQHAEKINPENSDLQTDLGQTYLKLKQLSKAAECFRKAVALSPANKWAEMGLLRATGESNPALMNALMLPENPSPSDYSSMAWFRARKAKKAGDFNEAVQLLTQALSWAPDLLERDQAVPMVW